MNYIDKRSYYQYDFWKNQGKTYKWLQGYDAAFEGKQLPATSSDEYKSGYEIGQKDKKREDVPPIIKDGLTYGSGYEQDIS